MSRVLLREVVFYVKNRIEVDKLTLDNYITTDNLLQNKKGISQAINLPPNTGMVTNYIEEDVLISNIRPYLKKIWFANNKGGSSSDVLTFRVKKNFFPKYVYYNLFSDDFFIHVMNGSKGTKMPRGDKNQILDFTIPNFPLSTQKKIAKVLSDLDAKIEINNRINSELEAMAKLLYDYWFVQFDFPDENGQPYKSSGGEMVFSEVLKREVPKGWKVGIFDDLAEIIGGSTPSKSKTEYFTTNGIAWITPKDLSLNKGKKYITKGLLDVSEEGRKAASLKVMPKDTVLLSTRAPIGYIAISRNEVTTNQGFKSFVPNKGYSSTFIYYTIQSLIKKIEANASGSTFKEISTSNLKKIETFLPKSSVAEQFRLKTNPILKRQNLLELENQELTALRDWLLPMLMNGQVRVGE